MQQNAASSTVFEAPFKSWDGKRCSLMPLLFVQPDCPDTARTALSAVTLSAACAVLSSWRVSSRLALAPCSDLLRPAMSPSLVRTTCRAHREKYRSQASTQQVLNQPSPALPAPLDGLLVQHHRQQCEVRWSIPHRVSTGIQAQCDGPGAMPGRTRLAVRTSACAQP